MTPDWRRVGALADFADGEVGGARVALDDGRELKLAIARRGDAVYAFFDQCPHRGAPFSELGLLDDEGNLLCGWHYWAFRLSDGAHTVLPNLVVPCYPARVQGDAVLVDITGARRPAVAGIEDPKEEDA